jgi:trehalose-6-phosphate synthase
MRIIVNEERGLSQRSRINVICVFCVNPRSGMCLLVKELISCQQQRQHLLQHESA